MNSKHKCSNCKDYFAVQDMYRNGLNGVCSLKCLNELAERARKKRQRRQDHKASRVRYGRRLPGAVRERVRARDGLVCRWCGGSPLVQIHHCRYRSEGGPDRAENLLTLCPEHHEKAHSNKKEYQPLLLLVLWYQYEKNRYITVSEAIRLQTDETLKEAKTFSDLVMSGRKGTKK